MTRSFRSVLPWIVAGIFAAAFLSLLILGVPRRRPSAAVPEPSAEPQRKVLYWVDPMHPEYRSDKPGTAPDCGMDLVPVYADDGAASLPASSEEGYAAIRLSPERRQAIGLAVAVVERRELVKTIRAVGRVTADERRLHRVHTKVEGYVEDLFVDFTGRRVRRGEPLLSIYSPDLLATQQEYLRAWRARERLGPSPNRELSRSVSELYEAAHQRLLLWDIPSSEIQRLERTGEPHKALTLVSPADGVVIAKNVVGGTRVTPGDVLFEIADLSRVWVLADIYESEIPLVRPAQTARMTLAYLPGRVWTGRVSFVAPLVNPESRTVAVRLEFDNFDGTLKPEMFADVLLERSLGSVVAVPEEAVLSTGTRFLVFVDKGDGVLEPRDVEPGDRVERWWEIRRGIAPGEKVVTQANFLIDSESRLKAALAGLAPAAGDHAHAAPAPTPSGAAPRPPPPPTPGPSSHDHSGHGGAAASGDRP